MVLTEILPSALLICLVIFHRAQSQCDTPSITTATGTHAPPPGSICSGDVIFADEFDDLNLYKWQHESTISRGNSEFQWYTNSRDNSWVNDGVLKIKPTLVADEEGDEFLYSGSVDIYGSSPADECTYPRLSGCVRTANSDNIINPVKSARMRTVHSFSFKYGKVEVNAKLPAGDWLWPAIWMMPRNNQYSGWPASGEFDIMESRGNRDLVTASGSHLGTQSVGQTLHWGPNSAHNQWRKTHFEFVDDGGYDGDFHRYQLEWTPEGITFGLDDVKTATISPPSGGFWELGELDSSGLNNPWKYNSKMAPFDQEFYLILNLAVGGMSFFPDDAINPGGKPWSNNSPRGRADFWEGRDQWLPTWQMDTDNAAFQIDYVRVWAL